MLGIEIMKRLGGGGVGVVSLANDAVSGTRYAEWKLGSDGYTYTRTGAGAFVKDNSWLSPPHGASKFEVKATLASGTTPAVGTVGSWLGAATNPVWGWAADDAGDDTVLTIEIRGAADHIIVDSATITLHTDGFEI